MAPAQHDAARSGAERRSALGGRRSTVDSRRSTAAAAARSADGGAAAGRWRRRLVVCSSKNNNNKKEKRRPRGLAASYSSLKYTKWNVKLLAIIAVSDVHTRRFLISLVTHGPRTHGGGSTHEEQLTRAHYTRGERRGADHQNFGNGIPTYCAALSRPRNKQNSLANKATTAFFVFFNKKKTAQVAWFNSHKKGKEPHPGLLQCIIF